jgi:hypothetical protein
MEDRRLAAIVFTDIVGYSSMMERDENIALAMVQLQREILSPIISAHSGQWLKEMGDGTLSCFASASRAVLCAIEIQTQLKNIDQFELRIGIHLGDIVFSEQDVLGDGVNIASRIEAIAQPGGIAISGQVFDTLSSNKRIETSFLGEKRLKNIDRAIRVYAVSNNGLPVGNPWGNSATESARSLRHSALATLSNHPWASSLVLASAGIIFFGLASNQQPADSIQPANKNAAAIDPQTIGAQNIGPQKNTSQDQSAPSVELTGSAVISLTDNATPSGDSAIDSPPDAKTNRLDPEAIFVTPVVESVPSFSTQLPSSAPSTELADDEPAAILERLEQEPAESDTNAAPNATKRPNSS